MAQRRYRWVFANGEDHSFICNFTDLCKADLSYNAWLGFYLNKKPIGSGRLVLVNQKKKWVHTESVGLYDGFLQKGHGLPLYLALIAAARKIGAKRIYSSRRLNMFSKRMWKTKLSKAGFDVKTVIIYQKSKRRDPKERYFIDL